MREEEHLNNLYNSYISYLLNKDRKNAESIILNAVKDGINIKDIYLKVFQRSQYYIGELWQNGTISVAQEHYCTAITQTVMSYLYQYIFQTAKIGKNFLSFCITEELHDLGLKMITDLIEMTGFDTFYLGANVPIKQIEEAINEYKADVVGISITMATQINALVNLIQTIRSIKTATKIKIIVGGYCLNRSETLWKKTGADEFARDGDEAAKKTLELVSKD